MKKPMGGLRLPKKPPHDRHARRLTRAVQMHHAGDPEGALKYYCDALARDLENPTALYYAALAKDQLGHDRESAIPYMLKCLQLLQPHTANQTIAHFFADASFNLGKFYLSTGEEEQSHTALLAALEHNPDHTESMVGIGDHQWSLGNRGGAALCWYAAVNTPPRCPEAAQYRSFIRLRLGTPQGWDDWEARWQCRMFVHQYGRPEYGGIPLWVDQEVDGKRIIVHGEQGHGDVIQCVRYLPLLRERGARVILEAHAPLVRLLRHSFPWADVFARGETYPHLVDLHIPSFSLPHRFGGANPNAPYLSSPSGEFRIPADAPFRVALCWRGSKQHANDRNRSCGVEYLTPLWSVPGVEWVSLQVGEAADEADGTPMMRVDDKITDFADTADIIARSDLTLSVDTAVAHLAGALGSRVWMMTPVLSEWRWGVDQPTTDLYPSMRIFRQTERNNWPSVIRQVRAALTELVEGGW